MLFLGVAWRSWR